MNTFFLLFSIFPFADWLVHTTASSISSASHSSLWLLAFYSKNRLDSHPAFDRNLTWKWYLFKRSLSSEIGERYLKSL